MALFLIISPFRLIRITVTKKSVAIFSSILSNIFFSHIYFSFRSFLISFSLASFFVYVSHTFVMANCIFNNNDACVWRYRKHFISTCNRFSYTIRSVYSVVSVRSFPFRTTWIQNPQWSSWHTTPMTTSNKTFEYTNRNQKQQQNN